MTFATHERDGTTIAMSPASLEEREVTPFVYAAHARRDTPPFLAANPSRVRLANGGSVSCRTDEASGRVFAQAFGADGTWVGSPLAVSPEGMTVLGAPQLVAADGHAVVAFFISTEDGFALVAASLVQVR